MRSALLGICVAALVCGASAFLSPHNAFDELVVVHRVADVTLTDDRNHAYPLAVIPARGAIMATGYTRCKDQCPLAFSRATAAVARLPARSRPRIVFITIDPIHDSPTVLRAFASMWPIPIVGVTGDVHDIARAVTSLGSAMPRGNDISAHDARLVFVAHGGEVRATVGPDADDALIGSALRSIDATR